MTWEAWASVLIVLANVVAVARGLAGPDLVLTAAMGLLLALGILSPAEAAKGFGVSFRQACMRGAARSE